MCASPFDHSHSTCSALEFLEYSPTLKNLTDWNLKIVRVTYTTRTSLLPEDSTQRPVGSPQEKTCMNVFFLRAVYDHRIADSPQKAHKERAVPYVRRQLILLYFTYIYEAHTVARSRPVRSICYTILRTFELLFNDRSLSLQFTLYFSEIHIASTYASTVTKVFPRISGAISLAPKRFPTKTKPVTSRSTSFWAKSMNGIGPMVY